MSEPQISHRCPSCGASIRVRGLFCPHCGETWPEPAPRASSPRVDPASQPESADGSADVSGKQGQKARVSLASSEVSSGEEGPVESVSAEPAAAVALNSRPGPRETVNRARVAARDVSDEDRFQGVEKLRHISSIVLDEAAYDPSLRFVLVAAILFLLFLVMLVISEVLR